VQPLFPPFPPATFLVVSVSSSDRASGATTLAEAACDALNLCFSILVGSSLWCNHLAIAKPGFKVSGFSILVGSSLWCNHEPGILFRTVAHVSVSSSDRASGATNCSLVAISLPPKFQYPRRIEASGATYFSGGANPAQLMFQYPRRIEPLVQHDECRITEKQARSFSILVGSSLWCNGGWLQRTDARYEVSVSSSDRASGATTSDYRARNKVIVVSVSSSDRASGATGGVDGSGNDNEEFQYPRRIEPLVQHRGNRDAAAPGKVSVSSSDRASGATLRQAPARLGADAFQYPRRIEPLVQPPGDAMKPYVVTAFQYPRRIEPLVQPRSTSRPGRPRSGFQYPRRIEPLVQLQPAPQVLAAGPGFQYPRRIEPLVQLPGSRGRSVPRRRGFSILVGSSLWCNGTPVPPAFSIGKVSVSSSDRASGATP